MPGDDEHTELARLRRGGIHDRRHLAGRLRVFDRDDRDDEHAAPATPAPGDAISIVPSSSSRTATTMIATSVNPAIAPPISTPKNTKPTNIGTIRSAGTTLRHRAGIRLKRA